MKLQRLFMLGLMVTSIALITSCSDGEDGKNGADGVGITSVTQNSDGTLTINFTDGTSTTTGNIIGDDGVGIVSTVDNGDGTFTINFSDGTSFTTGNLTGDPGADGNANVRRIIMETGEVAEATNPVTLTSAFFPDLEELDAETLDTSAILTYLVTPDIGLYAPIPATIDLNGLRIFNVGFALETVTINETTGAGWSNIVSEVHLILIEQSSVTGGGSGGGGGQSKAQTDIMASLKAAQVDINNYQEVMQYFGLDQ